MARFGIPSIIIETCCFSGVSSNPSFLSTNQWEFGTSMVAWYSAGPPCCESSGSAVPRVSQGYRARLESPSSAQSGKPRLLPNSSCLFLNRFIHDLGWDSPKTSLEKNMENSP